MTEISYRILSNLDSLDERAIHKAFVDMVGNNAKEGGDFLKAIVPKGKTLQLTTQAGHKGPIDDGNEIKAAVGIPRIETTTIFYQTSTKDAVSPGGQDAGDYPIFTNRGTGDFGPAGTPIFARRVHFMRLPPDGEHSVFHKEVRGQEGKHFMAATNAAMQAGLRVDVQRFKAEISAQNKASQLLIT